VAGGGGSNGRPGLMWRGALIAVCMRWERHNRGRWSGARHRLGRRERPISGSSTGLQTRIVKPFSDLPGADARAVRMLGIDEDVKLFRNNGGGNH
jgi:hypothetical protein